MFWISTHPLFRARVIMPLLTEEKPRCALCHQLVEIKGFCLKTAAGEKKFCCAGCLSIYQLLYENTLPQLPSTPN